MSTEITISALDSNGNFLFQYSVPFTLGMSVKQVMETAFVLNQQPPPNADPFLYAVEYYGYSEDPHFPVYLGYEVERIGNKATGMLPTDSRFYWELDINDQPSATGADTAYPLPGSRIVWKLQPVPADTQNLNVRARIIHSRRAARKAANV